MKLEYLEDLTDKEQSTLREQEVCLDDWDYMLIVYDVDQFQETEEDREYYSAVTHKDELKKVKVYSPKLWHLDRLLTGCCSNIWYKIKWKGKFVMLGAAYHS